MMTIVTHVTLQEGTEPEWDATMRDRIAAACDRPAGSVASSSSHSMPSSGSSSGRGRRATPGRLGQ